MAIVAAAHCGCRTSPRTLELSNRLGSTNALRIAFRKAVLSPDATPALYSFQKAEGKRGSAKEALTDVELGLGSPALGVIVPGIILGGLFNSADVNCRSGASGTEALYYAAFAGAAGGVAAAGTAVVAPALAAKDLIRSWKKISPQELAERETDLQKALKNAAMQDEFQHFLLVFADRKSPGRLVASNSGQETTEPSLVDTVFEARVEELRLERAGSDEGSYFLKIKVCARLVRKSDYGLIYQQSVDYRSGNCLFLDWTYHGALEGVAQTGYRALADYITSLVFQP